jgi:hypothetical protein
VADPPPVGWNEGLLTMTNVDALYDSELWAYLREAMTPLMFGTDDATFHLYVTRLRLHLENWAQAYRESTHESVPRNGELHEELPHTLALGAYSWLTAEYGSTRRAAGAAGHCGRLDGRKRTPQQNGIQCNTCELTARPAS